MKLDASVGSVQLVVNGRAGQEDRRGEDSPAWTCSFENCRYVRTSCPRMNTNGKKPHCGVLRCGIFWRQILKTLPSDTRMEEAQSSSQELELT